MLVIGLFKKIQNAAANYRSRRQLKQLSDDELKDIALSYYTAAAEGEKANAFVFFKESLFGSLDQSNERESKRRR